MIALVLCSFLTVAAEPDSPFGPPVAPPSMPDVPETMDEALGTEQASVKRKIGLASAVTGSALLVLSGVAFTMGLDTERELRERPHTRAESDKILLERTALAAVAWPSLVLGAAGVGAGITLLVLEEGSAP